MDVDFMLSDSLEVLASWNISYIAHLAIQAVRPKLVMYKTVEEAAIAVDEMFTAVFQNAGCTLPFRFL
jgi:regulator of nonsense transcripts 2